jgi:hypothetical protein
MAVVGLAGLVKLGRQRRGAGWLLLGLFVVFLAFYGTLGNWLGGRSYGSRYLLVTLPFLAIGVAWLLASLHRPARQAVCAGLLAIGILVQIPGVLIDYAKVSQSASFSRAFTTSERQWSPGAAPFVLNARALPARFSENMDYLMARRSPPAVSPPTDDDDRGFSQQFAFSLDFWWLYLFYFGLISRTGVFLLIGAALVSSMAVGLALARTARSASPPAHPA